MVKLFEKLDLITEGVHIEIWDKISISSSPQTAYIGLSSNIPCEHIRYYTISICSYKVNKLLNSQLLNALTSKLQNMYCAYYTTGNTCS